MTSHRPALWAALAAAALVALAACGGGSAKKAEPKGERGAAFCNPRALTETLNAVAQAAASGDARARSAAIAGKRAELQRTMDAADRPTTNAGPLDRLACAASGATAAMLLLEIPVGEAGQTEDSAAAAGQRMGDFSKAVGTACSAMATEGRSTEDSRRCALGKLFAAGAPAVVASNAYASAQKAAPTDVALWRGLAQQAENWGEAARTAWPDLSAEIAALPGSRSAPDLDLVVNGRLTRLACDLQGRRLALESSAGAAIRTLAASDADQANTLRDAVRSFLDAHRLAYGKAAEALKIAPSPAADCAPGGDPARCVLARSSGLNVACLGPWGVAPRPAPGN